MRAFYRFLNLEETELRDVVFLSQTNVSYGFKEEHVEANRRWIRADHLFKLYKIRIRSIACAPTASVCEWLHTLLSPVPACLGCDVCTGSPLTLSSAIMRGVVCCVRWGALVPEQGLIGVKRAALKSHRCLEMLSETGNLLLATSANCWTLCVPVCSIVSPSIPSS